MTKIGIISDIHSNFEGLTDALEILNQQGIDKTSIYVCGDIVGYGDQPNECCQLIRDLGLITVAGNHDYAVAGFVDWRKWSYEAEVGIKRTLKILDPGHKDWLRALPLTYYREDFEMAHSTLELPEEFLYPAVGRSLFDPWQDVKKTFAVMEEQVCFVGHSHMPTIFLEKSPDRISVIDPSQPLFLKNRRAVVDVGSVGYPRRASKKSSLVIYDRDEHLIEYVRFRTKPLIRIQEKR